MTIRVDNDDVERLADEIRRTAGESEMEAVRAALPNQRGRLSPGDARRIRLAALVAEEIWPGVRRERPPGS